MGRKSGDEGYFSFVNFCQREKHNLRTQTHSRWTAPPTVTPNLKNEQFNIHTVTRLTLSLLDTL